MPTNHRAGDNEPVPIRSQVPVVSDLQPFSQRARFDQPLVSNPRSDDVMYSNSTLQTASANQALSRYATTTLADGRRMGTRWIPSHQHPSSVRAHGLSREQSLSLRGYSSSSAAEIFGNDVLLTSNENPIAQSRRPSHGSTADSRTLAFNSNDIVLNGPDRRRPSALSSLTPEFVALARSLSGLSPRG